MYCWVFNSTTTMGYSYRSIALSQTNGPLARYGKLPVAYVVVVLLFPANTTTMERYSIIQNKLLEATREAIRLIGLVALIMSCKVNKCMWPTGVRGQGSGRGMYHGAKRTCRFRGVCTGNAGNVFPATAGLRSQHASRHVRDARAVMHVGIAY